MRGVLLFVAAVMLGGCVTMTDKQREQLEYRQVEWQEQFRMDLIECRAQGGLMIIEPGIRRLGRSTTPKYGDKYTCER